VLALGVQNAGVADKIQPEMTREECQQKLLHFDAGLWLV
jgi:hypothetical protein